MTRIDQGAPRLHSKRARARKRREGMTLVEIMIVVIIMALIATAVGVAVVPRLNKARVDQTTSDVRAVLSAATMWVAENPGGECPSVQKLVDDGQLNKSSRLKDAWENEFKIECEGEEPTVISGGPDGQMGNDDDIRTDRLNQKAE